MAVKSYSSPGSQSMGENHKEVNILTIDNDIAVCKDRAGNRIMVNVNYLRTKGPAPLPNEKWIIDRTYGGWTFAIALKYDPVIIHQKYVGNFATNGVLKKWTITHNLGTLDHNFNIYDADNVHQTVFTVAVGDDEDIVTTPSGSAALATQTYRFVAIG